MTASQQTLNTSSPSLRLAPVVGTGILAAALLIGGLALSRPHVAPIAKPAVAVPTFDAVQFRAGERAALGAVLTFDAIQFRAGERAALSAPVFDAVQFRAEERSGVVPNAATSASGGGHILAK